jgi:hypothetical protein
MGGPTINALKYVNDKLRRACLTYPLQRWREALDPNIKRGPWGDHEDDKLVEMFRIHGRKWNDIAASLDGRPPVQVHPTYFQLM